MTSADLPLLHQDMLYLHQLSLTTPPLLSPLAFHAAAIVKHEKASLKVHAALLSAGILSPAGEIRTSAIDRNFTHKLAFLSQGAKRRIVSLLFFWEEEARRLRSLTEMEGELMKSVLGSAREEEEGRVEMEAQLQEVRRRIGMRPGLRMEGMNTGTGSVSEELPAYTRFA